MRANVIATAEDPCDAADRGRATANAIRAGDSHAPQRSLPKV